MNAWTRKMIGTAIVLAFHFVDCRVKTGKTGTLLIDEPGMSRSRSKTSASSGHFDDHDCVSSRGNNLLTPVSASDHLWLLVTTFGCQ